MPFVKIALRQKAGRPEADGRGRDSGWQHKGEEGEVRVSETKMDGKCMQQQQAEIND